MFIWFERCVNFDQHCATFSISFLFSRILRIFEILCLHKSSGLSKEREGETERERERVRKGEEERKRENNPIHASHGGMM